MSLTADSQAILLICSRLGLPAETDPAPFTLREWNLLEQKLPASPLGSPGALLGLGAKEIRAALDLSETEAERLARLLARGGSLAIELERLRSLGIWMLARGDENYPVRLRQRLKESAPAVLSGSGEMTQLGQPGLAVVGSRNVDEAGKAFAEYIGNACAQCGLVVYSGAARGVDLLTMSAALEARGTAVGVVADSLQRAVRAPDTRSALGNGNLTLITPYAPDAGFSVGAAMGRNKLIYALADYALVIASDVEKGGTWAGANEALRARWVPVFALGGPTAPEGNRLLIQKGALPFPDPFPDSPSMLGAWLDARAVEVVPPRTQATLF